MLTTNTLAYYTVAYIIHRKH